MRDIQKIVKNYYEIFANPTCGVFLDEYLMKKANKILYKYELEIKGLLENNSKHLIKHEWSLAYPNKKQTSFHSFKPIDKYSLLSQGFTTKKVENIFDIGDERIYDKKIEKEITKLLEKENKNER
jgi:hypothetical protein